MKKNWRFAAVLLMALFIFTIIACDFLNKNSKESSSEVSTYTVKFDCSTTCEVPDQIIESGKVATKPEDPTRIDYAFKGWYRNDEPFDFKTMINNDITLTPKWLELFKVTFINYDNTFIDEVIVEEGESADRLETPTRLCNDQYHYVFKQWDNNIDVVTSDLVVKAIYDAILNEFTVRFVDYDDSEIETKVAKYGENLLPPNSPLRVGYAFSGWDSSFSDVRSNLTIKALYKINKYTISFNSNDGSEVNPITLDYGTNIAKPTNPVKEGMSFVYWTLNGERYVFNTIPAENITLDAVWEIAGTDGLVYTLNSDSSSYSITRYSNNLIDIVVPQMYNDLPVTKIGECAFASNTTLNSVKLPITLIEIGNRAFYRCSNLTYVEMLEGITTIGDFAFNNTTKLTTLVLPNSVNYLGEYSFGNSSISGIIIPNNVSVIKKGTFVNCRNLVSLLIPDNITTIEDNAFAYDNYLTSIHLPLKLEVIGSHAFDSCTNLQNVSLPITVKVIKEYAFYMCASLQSIVIPNGVNTISNSTFSYCSNLTSVTLPNSLTLIDDFAFQNCTRLNNIILPNNLITIGELAFMQCTGLTTIVIPTSVLQIENSTFANCFSLTIYCRVNNKPETWHEYWNYTDCFVIWGYIY